MTLASNYLPDLERGKFKESTTTAGQPAVVVANGDGTDIMDRGIYGEDSTNILLATQIKPIAAATYSPSVYANLGAATTANIKASPANLYSVSVTNANATIRYFQVFNNTNGSTVTLLWSFPIPPSTGLQLGRGFFSEAGFYLSAGLTFGVSTTINSYVAATAADHITIISYF